MDGALTRMSAASKAGAGAWAKAAAKKKRTNNSRFILPRLALVEVRAGPLRRHVLNLSQGRKVVRLESDQQRRAIRGQCCKIRKIRGPFGLDVILDVGNVEDGYRRAVIFDVLRDRPDRLGAREVSHKRHDQVLLLHLANPFLSLIHISEPTRLLSISYAVF